VYLHIHTYRGKRKIIFIPQPDVIPRTTRAFMKSGIKRIV